MGQVIMAFLARYLDQDGKLVLESQMSCQTELIAAQEAIQAAPPDARTLVLYRSVRVVSLPAVE
jgi:hypothetical protein